jgi:hypothetical protein
VVRELLDEPHHENDRPDQEEDMMKLHGYSSAVGKGWVESLINAPPAWTVIAAKSRRPA